MGSGLLYSYYTVIFCLRFSPVDGNFLPEIPDTRGGDSDWLHEELFELPEYIPRYVALHT